MIETKPFITFVVPTRDRLQVIRECLHCIQNQTDCDFECIVSDNGVKSDCRSTISDFLADPRFSYRRPSSSLNMSDHWEFAIRNAKGTYLSIIGDTHMLRRDCVQVLKSIAADKNPDVMSWKFERFEVKSEDGGRVTGEYHPLIKPRPYKEYSASDELHRRFSFEHSIFHRQSREFFSYGKIYSGCVRIELLQRIIDTTGRVFHGFNPDFTSMALILNYSEVCIDVNQSLMMELNGFKYSNGSQSKSSIPFLLNYISTYSIDIESYIESALIKEVWFGLNMIIAIDLVATKKLVNEGKLTSCEVNLDNLLKCAFADMSEVKDWGSFDKAKIERGVKKVMAENPTIEKLSKDAIDDIRRPSVDEIYHAGLAPVPDTSFPISSVELANENWSYGHALPRKHVGGGILFSVAEAEEYFYDYTMQSSMLLKL